MGTDNLAPIVLFVYNRLDHTKCTIDHLKKNRLANQSNLYIYSDAAKTIEDNPAVDAVRQYIKSVDGFKEVKIIERAANRGLADSIISGVTEVCEKHGKVIVLEDDLETSPWFLTYMNESLEMYKEQNQVMHISGCCYPIEPETPESTFFLQVPLCWGWATWHRAWQYFEKDLNMIGKFSDEQISLFNFDDTYDYFAQLTANRDGRLDTWFVFWYATVFLDGGLSLFPSVSMVRNIGMDGSGTNCSNTNVFQIKNIATKHLFLEPIPLRTSGKAFSLHKNYFKAIRPSLLSKIKQRSSRLLS